jgi:integrase
MMRPISLDDFLARAGSLYETGRHAKKTAKRVRQVSRELTELLGPTATTADLTTHNMAAYVAGRGPRANSNTTNGLLSSIAALTSYAVEEGWLDRSPAWRRVRLRPTKMKLNKPPDYDQLARLLTHLRERRNDSWESSRLCGLIWLIALTGVRLGEATHAHWEDWSPAGLAIDPSRSRLKTQASARTVPVPDALTELLEERRIKADTLWIHSGVRRRGPWTGGTCTSRPLGQFRRAAADVGIANATLHSLRHAFGTTAVGKEAIPLWIVSKVMGHSDLRTTARYLHLDGAPEIDAAFRGFGYSRT